jgi:PhzF family phenazine biosynthesis protein
VERWTYHILDVFTDRPLAGNQLAVFEEAPDIPETLLQPLAKEIGFAETVFLYPAQEGNEARMRIFTPENEIPFAGHPTLGAATVVAHRLGKDRVVLETGRGPVPVRIERTIGRASQGAMDQPIPSFALYAHENALLRALGAQHSRLPVTVYDNGIPHVYVLLDHPDDVAALQPDLAALTRLARESGAPIVGSMSSRAPTLNGKPECLRRPTAFPKIPRPDPPLVHWPSISPGTASFPGQPRSTSPRVRKSAGQARSLPWSSAVPITSSASRSVGQ